MDKALALEFNRRYGVNAVENALKIAEVVSKYKPTAVVFNTADLWTPPYSEEELSKALGLPVVYASAAKRQGVEKLKELLGKGLPRGEVRPVKLEPPATAVVRTRKGGGADALTLQRGEIYRCVRRSRGETRGEDPSPLQFLKYYASPRQNYGVGTFHISNKTLRLKTLRFV